MQKLNMGHWDDKVRERVKEIMAAFPGEMNATRLAKLTGWGQGNVSNYLNAKGGATLDRLGVIADKLGVRMADLFTEAAPKIDEVQALLATASPPVRDAVKTLLLAAEREQSPPATPPPPPASPGKRGGGAG